MMILPTGSLQSWKGVLQASPSLSLGWVLSLKKKLNNSISALKKNWKKRKTSTISPSLTKLLLSMKTIAVYFWIFSPLVQSNIAYFTVVVIIFYSFTLFFKLFIPRLYHLVQVIWTRASVSPSVVPNFHIFILENVDGIWWAHFPHQMLDLIFSYQIVLNYIISSKI